MPAREEIHYFGAGPARLPATVLTRASASILNHNNTGLGLSEQSHRSPASSAILEEAKSALKSLLSVPDDYSILFMQGGGTTQFSCAVYNLLGHRVQEQLEAANGDLEAVRAWLKGKKIDYLVTGGWSQKASEEAKRLLGEEWVNIAVDGRTGNGGKYGAIPEEKEWNLTAKEDSLFTYFCDNETVDGVEFLAFPQSLDDKERFVVCDMSSNILSRAVDVKKYDVIFAGAQKNVGTTGLTILIVRNAIFQRQPSVEILRALNLPIPPIMMDFKTIAKNNSLYNTLPIFDVWIAGEVMKELVAAGGIVPQEALAGRKSEKIYNAISAYPDLFHIVPCEGCRSRMNICFRIFKPAAEGQTVDLEEEFVKAASLQGLTGLKGHRSVGGIRISNYNSISEESVDKLVAYIKGFSEKHGN
ncbi:Phosphoserine transaminase [Rhizina undulata]